ncbi:TraK family protein [Alcaligenes ammonioxydans]|uniref:TraK family protein n=1 Tax=Alcaligenes ammonioxydans TaxID=2582914 RepID=UPI001F05BDDE|nr:TraK family protein [Alcaligenes ammonioxydans]MCH1879080.1 TraK family protein [Alcaligenes ammonioxydans]
MSHPHSDASLSERIAASQTKSSPTSHLNRAKVLALRAEIRQALDDGWSVLAIYKTLLDEERVNFSYQAFRRHVNGLLLGKAKARKRPSHTTTITQTTQPASTATGFTFNPQAKKEDLI